MSLVRLEREGPVAHVVLARPERHNALLPEMWQTLARIGEELGRDEQVKVVVVRGEGPSFSSGIDREALADGVLTPFGFTGDEADRDREHYEERDIVAAQATARWLIEGDFVSIAAVRGYALGAGAQIAMACDIRVVGDDAQWALPEVEIGLFPEMTAVAVLPGIVGYDHALELALTGRRFDAREAERLGLATRLVPADEVVAVATELAERIARARPDAIRYCKRAMRRGRASDVDGALAVARQGGLRLLRGIQEYWTWERAGAAW